jgi:hypothetical protein
MSNTLILGYAGRGLCTFTATDENISKLRIRVRKLNVQDEEFLDAATRLMDAGGDLAGPDLDMTIFLALCQIGDADLDDADVREILSSEKIVAGMVRADDGHFLYFSFARLDSFTLIN